MLPFIQLIIPTCVLRNKPGLLNSWNKTNSPLNESLLFYNYQNSKGGLWNWFHPWRNQCGFSFHISKPGISPRITHVHMLTHFSTFFKPGTSGSSQSLQRIKYMINPGWLLCNQLQNYINLYLYSFTKLNTFFLRIVILNLVKLTMYNYTSCHISFL